MSAHERLDLVQEELDETRQMSIECEKDRAMQAVEISKLKSESESLIIRLEALEKNANGGEST